MTGNEKDKHHAGHARTHAMTPDKMDKSSRKTKKEQKTEGKNKPYPLTEEEATPRYPETEQRESD